MTAVLASPAVLVALKEGTDGQLLQEPPAFEVEGPLQWSVKTGVPVGGGMGMQQRCAAYECNEGEESAFEEMMAETAGSLGRDVEGLMCSCASMIRGTFKYG